MVIGRKGGPRTRQSTVVLFTGFEDTTALEDKKGSDRFFRQSGRLLSRANFFMGSGLNDF